MTSDEIVSGRVLVVEDRSDTLSALRILLKSAGFEFDQTTSPEQALKKVLEKSFDVVLMDMNYSRDTTSGEEGLDLLSSVREIDQSVSVVVMTAWSSIKLAIEAMRRGANDFVEKPWENERLLSILRVQTELVQTRRREDRLLEENRILHGDVEIIADSPAMQPVLELIRQVAPSDEAILITGENGVGKGVFARLLHATSNRSEQGFVSVNIGSLSSSIFESELFGHEDGAFTGARGQRIGRFELADNGTLFLDEIANVPPELQAKLLHVVETGEFERVGSSKRQRANVRLISATNADLRQEIDADRFRQDLYYRLNAVEILIPPLRERPEDTSRMANHFLARYSRKYRRELSGFSPAALNRIAEHRWPGNVRELDHAIARAVLVAKGAQIEADDLGIVAEESSFVGKMTLEEVERLAIQKAMARCSNNVVKAAGELGVSRSALYRRLQRFGLYSGESDEFDSDRDGNQEKQPG